ncbi:MAG: hypothetical protein ACMVY4_19110 [Minwuia sp.]|uniref:hypothetical protein n=1 Tax=Minwuia sp. TaxID=2493630 RepID=UPI003A8C4D67
MRNGIWLMTAAAVLLAGQALAQTAGDNQPEAEVIKIYDENTLTPDDIRACLKTDQDIVAMEAQLADYEKTLAGFQQEIRDLAADLDRRRKQIDGTDAKAVDAYNKRVDRHGAMIDRYNTRFLPTLAERRSKLNAAIDTYNTDCADKAYFEEDWLAAVEEMGIEDPRAQAGGGK